jgi:hypothetical protein
VGIDTCKIAIVDVIFANAPRGPDGDGSRVSFGTPTLLGGRCELFRFYPAAQRYRRRATPCAGSRCSHPVVGAHPFLTHPMSPFCILSVHPRVHYLAVRIHAPCGELPPLGLTRSFLGRERPSLTIGLGTASNRRDSSSTASKLVLVVPDEMSAAMKHRSYHLMSEPVQREARVDHLLQSSYFHPDHEPNGNRVVKFGGFAVVPSMSR